ncbi:hypothetical protein [Kumtagia ephedrae]|nr:hypothetical protein [Mesorhizobium ephedrae]
MSQASVVEKEDALAEKVATKGTARSKASQEKGWKSVLTVAKRFLKDRPNDHLSSLLVELRELNISRKDPGRYYVVKDIVKNIGGEILGNEGKDLGDGFYYPDVRNGKYALGHISQIRYLSQLIRRDTTGIMELGSGWSSNLFQLFIAHGATRSKKLIYYGGEYTREGQICARYIAGTEPNMAYRAFNFDFRDPDVTFLKRQKGHILLFTSHSIEQVDAINPILFSQLKEIANEVTVVHFEPVGWQREPELLNKRENHDDAFFESIGEKALAGNIESVAENAAWWSWRLNYNTNLLRIVKGLEKEGSIRVRRMEYDFNGQANVLNPSSLIHYDFVR